MKILVVGGGGREHALVWKLARSPRVSQVYAAPGNAGTAAVACNLPLRDTDVDGLAGAVREHGIDLVVVGPEAPLAAGIVDRFQELGIPIFGPTRRAAEIESSKAFAKELMQRYGIPCARGVTFSDPAEAREYARQQAPPIVVKADGLAAGKGVTVAESVEQALEAVSGLMEAGNLGEAGRKVVIEECLTGREVSCFVFTDGRSVVPLGFACDYKRIYDGDCGPNTGGMGSYSPPPFLSDALKEQIFRTIMEPAVRALAAEGRPYRGVLYGGLMLTATGPRVIEFNARLGDPETQVLLPRLETDLVEIIEAVLEGGLERLRVKMCPEACVAVVVASRGYPGSYQTGYPVSGLDSLDDGVLVFQAGTRLDEAGRVVTSGGRVLAVVATGATLAEARRKVYASVGRVQFEGCYYRKDIALLEA